MALCDVVTRWSCRGACAESGTPAEEVGPGLTVLSTEEPPLAANVKKVNNNNTMPDTNNRFMIPPYRCLD